MPFALSVFEQRFDIVVAQSGPVAHVSRFDLQSSALTLGLDTQRCPQQIVQGVPKGGSAGAAFAFNAFHHVVIECNGGADAHDALMVASGASEEIRGGGQHPRIEEQI